MKLESIHHLLKGRNFVSVATADSAGKPNAAPKFFLKIEKNYMFLIDYSFATTTKNLRENPRMSVALMDLDNLQGYRLYGPVQLIEKGAEFKKIAKEIDLKAIQLSADRVIRGAKLGKRHEHFELEMPDKFIAYKFKVKEMTKIGTKGDLYRESY